MNSWYVGPKPDNTERFPWSKLDPIDGVKCPKCGQGFVCFRLDGDEESVLDWDFKHEMVPRYCPCCGECLGEL